MSNQTETRLERALSATHKSERLFEIIASISSSLVLIIGCIIFLDVILRFTLGFSLKGVTQITGLGMVVAVFFTIAYAQQEKAHVSIDILTMKLSTRGKVVVNNILYLLSLEILILTAWQSFKYAQYTAAGNISILQLNIAMWPFAAIVPFGFAMLILMIIRDTLSNIVEGLKIQLGSQLWVLSFGIFILISIGMILLILSAPLNVDLPTFGVIGIVAIILLFLSGMPISFLLLLFSFLLLASIKGPKATLNMLGYLPFRVIDSYVWAVIALFVMMGYLISAARFGRDLYDSAYKWFGHLHGGLAQTTIAVSTAFAAVVGDVISSTLTFGTVALPEMRRYKYSDSLSTGSICFGATLGPMIPPSVTFIVYGLVTNQSIGKLFIAGIIPGLMLAIAAMIYVLITCKLKPKIGPQGPAIPFKEKVISLRFIWPVFVLFIIVIGGIYGGIFTPNEAGGIGLTGALIIGLIMKRFKWQAFSKLLLETGRLIGMLFPIVIGALLLGYFIAASKVSIVMETVLTGENMPQIITIVIICLIFLFLGCFMDAIVIIMITVPIFYPVIIKMGYDPIWFGVLVALLVNLGMITPPFGVICFALKGVTDISLNSIFRGVIPFIIITLVVTALIIAFPKMVTFLPNLVG